jgi:four helix bundle protein
MAEGFEHLVVWQKAHALALFVHRRIVPLLPREEKWDLADQIRRASKSVSSNIAEGYGRYYYRDAVRFCYMARGSLCETQNHLLNARDLNYIPIDLYTHARNLSEEAYRLLNGYISYLKQRKPGKDEPGHDLPTKPLIPVDEDCDAPPPVPDPQSLIPNP